MKTTHVVQEVTLSISDILPSASSLLEPQMSSIAGNDPQTDGLEGSLNREQRLPSVKWMHRTPAGFPFGIPGIELEMLMAIQQAPQSNLQFMGPPYSVAKQSSEYSIPYSMISSLWYASSAASFGVLNDPLLNSRG